MRFIKETGLYVLTLNKKKLDQNQMERCQNLHSRAIVEIKY